MFEQTANMVFHMFDFWMRPELNPRRPLDVDEGHRRVARLVMTVVRERFPAHPVTVWTDSKWNPSDSTLSWRESEVHHILECINEVIYDWLEMKGPNGRARGIYDNCDRSYSMLKIPRRRHWQDVPRQRPGESEEQGGMCRDVTSNADQRGDNNAPRRDQQRGKTSEDSVSSPLNPRPVEPTRFAIRAVDEPAGCW